MAALGMQDVTIPDSAPMGTTSFTDEPTYHARLHAKGAWKPTVKDALFVDLVGSTQLLRITHQLRELQLKTETLI